MVAGIFAQVEAKSFDETSVVFARNNSANREEKMFRQFGASDEIAESCGIFGFKNR